MKLAEIQIGEHVRRDMGDVQGLADSIARHGLLHPVVVMKDGRLVAGRRRIEAVKLLGWDELPATVVDVADLLGAERDENTARKDFTPTEAVAIGRLIEEQERPKALEAKRAGGRKAHAVMRGEIPAVGQSTTPRVGVSEKVANALGMDRKRYERAKEVVAAADAEPRRFGDLPERMDATGNVAGTHREMQRRQGAHERHPVHYKQRRENAGFVIERAVAQLDAIRLSLTDLDLKTLDAEKRKGWGSALKKAASFLRKLGGRVHG